eukprot:gnl/Ergobibamus_cyprinoides/72.p1 GENE.gnl/Ergobibamus_cyprinoides/72~~gnl/Ergobibamus_cyprinoides/72.p1  ORF type:complete len:183 (+),score=90.53 gnl/Ergobibamus_cyprinoides/72:215-763(+)
MASLACLLRLLAFAANFIMSVLVMTGTSLTDSSARITRSLSLLVFDTPIMYVVAFRWLLFNGLRRRRVFLIVLGGLCFAAQTISDVFTFLGSSSVGFFTMIDVFKNGDTIVGFGSLIATVCLGALLLSDLVIVFGSYRRYHEMGGKEAVTKQASEEARAGVAAAARNETVRHAAISAATAAV